MNLRHFRAFRAVMVSGSAIEASRRLSLTPSAVSRLISGMEDQIGFKLFERVGGRLSPTPEGDAFFAQTETILQNFDDILSIATDIRTHRSARIRLTAIPLLAHGLLPDALARFLNTHPAVHVEINTQPKWDFGYWASVREFDLACTIVPAAHPPVESEIFGTVGGVVALPPGHPLAERDTLGVEDIRDEPLVVQPQNALVRNQVSENFKQAGLEMRPRIETVSSLSACQLVAKGLGIAVIDAFTARAFHAEQLQFLPWREEFDMLCAFVFPGNRSRSKVVQDFMAVVSSVLKDLQQETPGLFSRSS